MKKAFVMGMVVLSTLTGQLAIAGPVAAKAPREILKDYTKQSRESMFGKGGTAQGLNESSFNTVKKNLIKELQLPGKESSLNLALHGEAGRARMDNLVTIIAAKKLSENLSKTDPAEAQSIEAASNATAKLIANSILLKATKDSNIPLKAEELSLVRDSLGKLETISSDIIVNFSKAERDSYTQVLERLDTLADSGNKKSYEESFIDSIMEVKKVDRTKALEIAKKLKECV